MPSAMESRIDSLFALPAEELLEENRRQEALACFEELKAALNQGRVRAASRRADATWEVHPWVKRGILLGFRLGAIKDYSLAGGSHFFDKDTYPLKDIKETDGVRLVPGGTSVREGSYLGRDVTIMPPAFINVGAYVDDGTMIDSHALIGSCAQVGKRCHISAAAQIGGVLEPVGSLPVIIEDDVLVGGNCGIFEGALLRSRVILASGVILTRSMPVYDLVHNQIYRSREGKPLEIPGDAVVVAGSRAIREGKGKDWGLSLYSPIIVKYRDEKTEASVQLEEMLR